MKKITLMILAGAVISSLVFLNSSYAVYKGDTLPAEQEESVSGQEDGGVFPYDNLANPQDSMLEAEERVLTESDQKPYAEGRILIKLRESVDFGLEKTREDAYTLVTDNTQLNDLNDTYASSIKLAFTSLMREDDQTGAITILSSKERAEEVKARFSQRTARAPKNTEIPELNRWLVINLKEGMTVGEAIAAYQAQPEIVEYAQPDYIAELCFIPNDPYYGQQKLGLIGAENAWDISTGEGITVAVIDTGLDYNHPDIQDNVWINDGEDLNHNGIVDPSDFNNIDDDDNGYIDDIRGYDFAPEDNDPMDYDGHGTHVAGTIAAVGNNGIGIIGLSWNGKIMASKGFPDNAYQGGSIYDLSQAIIYAADNGADVLNNSWGYPAAHPNDNLSQVAVLYAYNLGCIVVFAAGNGADNVNYYSPQNMIQTITVSASTGGNGVGWSNWGDAIDVAAPGVNILSLKTSQTALPWWATGLVGTDYCVGNGTSFSAPHVAGLAALLLSHNPTLSYNDVRCALKLTADDVIGGGPGWDPWLGYGRINAYHTVNSIIVPHDYPTIQAAINAAVSGQDIIVLPGIYNENITMKTGVSVKGVNREITKIITADSVYLVKFLNVSNCAISGFTLEKGQTSFLYPVYINNSQDVKVLDSIIQNSYAGIFLGDNSLVAIRNNIIRNIDAFPGINTNEGGWDTADNLTADIRNNIIQSNKSGMLFNINQNSEVSVINNVVYDSMFSGIETHNITNGSSLLIMNNIIAQNHEGIQGVTQCSISYNDVWDNDTNYSGCSAGIGDISVNPMFTTNGDFRLAASSPCINTGDPNPIYKDPNNSINDMGAYGGPYAHPAQKDSIVIILPEDGGLVSSLQPLIIWHTSEIAPAENMRLKITHSRDQEITLETSYKRWLSLMDKFSGIKPAYALSNTIQVGTIVDLEVTVPNTGRYQIPSGVLSLNINYKLELILEADPTLKATSNFTPASPPAPNNFDADCYGTTQNILTWGGVEGAAEYKIWRSQDPNNFPQWPIVSLDYREYWSYEGQNVFSYLYLDNSLQNSTVYYYKLVASNSLGQSPPVYSDAMTGPEGYPPPAPSSFTAIALSPNPNPRIDLSWSDGPTNEDGYMIWRFTGGYGNILAEEPLEILGENVTSYIDTNLLPNTHYYYALVAYTYGGVVWSYQARTNAVTLNIPPTAPGSFNAAVFSPNTINLTWDNVLNEDGYKIWRATNPYSFLDEPTITVGPNITSYQDGGLPTGTYYYKLMAYNNGGNSGQIFSNSTSLLGSTIFVSSVSYPGNLSGFTGADNYCTSLANASDQVMHGQWRAWVSTEQAGGNALDRFALNGMTDLYLPDGTFIGQVAGNGAPGGAQISFSNTNINRDQNNNIVPVNTEVWSNTSTIGAYVSGANDCGNWNTGNNNSIKGRYGKVGAPADDWTDFNYCGCGSGVSKRVYCIFDHP